MSVFEKAYARKNRQEKETTTHQANLAIGCSAVIASIATDSRFECWRIALKFIAFICHFYGKNDGKIFTVSTFVYKVLFELYNEWNGQPEVDFRALEDNDVQCTIASSHPDHQTEGSLGNMYKHRTV